MTNLVFVDIDGVLRPGRCYFKRSQLGSEEFDPLSVAAVNLLCERAHAEVVFNSQWNRMMRGSLIEIARGQGLTASIRGFTDYPREPSRLKAVMDFIAYLDANCAEKVDKWCALDDASTSNRFFIKVDAEVGITLMNYRKATQIMGCHDPFVILL